MKTSFHKTATALHVFIACLEIGTAAIITKPNNAEAVIGETAIFNCSSSIPSTEIHWFYYDSKPNSERSFVYGFNQFYSGFGEFRIEKNDVTGACNLIIPSVAVVNAGKYECQDDVGRGEIQSAHLIVLDGVPVCQSNPETNKVIGPNQCGIEPSQLTLTCIVQYHGFEAPIMEWSKMGDNKSITDGVSHSNIDNQVIWNLTMNGDSVKNGSSFNCRATRSKSKRASCSSGNVTVVGKFVAAEVFTCPDCKPYQDAIICIIVLPLVVSGIAFLMLCLLVYKRKWKILHSPNEQEETKYPLKELQVFLTKRPDCVAVSVCAFLIIFPIVNSGFLILAWYLLMHRPTRLKREATTQEKKEFLGGEEIQIPLAKQKMYVEARTETDEKERKIADLEMTLKKLKRDNESEKKLREKLSGSNQKLETELNLREERLKQLTDKIKELEHRLYPPENIDYAQKPSPVVTIDVKSEVVKSQLGESKQMSKTYENAKEMESINGLTVLEKELFVLYANCSEIQVYDSATYQLERKFAMTENVIESHDMVSCKPDHCIYIISKIKDGDNSQIFKLHPSGDEFQPWPKPSIGKTGHLSVYDSNLIVCLHERQMINEYTRDGELIHTIRLSPAVGLIHPWHAIKTTSMHFVVSHGDLSDKLHRVCVVDLNGNIIKECSKWDKSGYKPYRELKVPIFLVEDDERSILVVDRENRRILILSSVLKYQRKLIKEEQGLKDHPLRMCFDETKTRLFVAVNSGRILIFNIK